MSKAVPEYPVAGPEWLQQIARVCSPDLQAKILALPPGTLARIEEIRFRLGQPVQLTGVGLDQFVHREQGLTAIAEDGYHVTEDHITRVVQLVTQASLYAVEDELKRGFVTMPGGHRVGVGGRVVLHDSGTVRTIRSITSVNIRIAKEHIGASRPMHKFLVRKPTEKPYNLLIISPPQCGKTTILRDLVRAASEGELSSGSAGQKVTVVDERSEIAGCVNGAPQFRLGPRTDVLDACPKAEGMLMAIRSLSPDIVATDEIGRVEDRDAILEATHAGVSVFTTAHAHSMEEWRERPAMRALFDSRAFQRYIVLSRNRGPGTIEQVLDAQGVPLRSAPSHAPRRGPGD